MDFLLLVAGFALSGSRASDYPLFRAYPSLQDEIRRVALLDSASPVLPLLTLENTLRASHGMEPVAAARVWVKDDGFSDHALGGNKARKLELLIADAQAQCAAGVMTSGRYGTHHGLSTAIAARRFGLRARLVLGPQPMSDAVRQQLLAMHAVGAELVYHKTLLGLGVDLLGEWLDGALHPGSDEYDIPPGGSNELGSVGYANAFLELVDQVGIEGLPDEIVVAAGTGGTASGLLAGACLAGAWEKTKIVAVGVVSPWLINGWTIRRDARKLFKYLRRRMSRDDRAKLDRCDFRWSPRAFDYRGDYNQPGYGAARPDVYNAIALAEETERLKLEPTYTGKAMLYLLDRVNEDLAAGRPVRRMLFWQTYNSHDLNELIDPYPWTDPARKWRDLPKEFWHLFE